MVCITAELDVVLLIFATLEKMLEESKLIARAFHFPQYTACTAYAAFRDTELAKLGNSKWFSLYAVLCVLLRSTQLFRHHSSYLVYIGVFLLGSFI